MSRVTYVVPTGDRSLFLSQALHYIARQRMSVMPLKEVVVVDGGARRARDSAAVQRAVAHLHDIGVDCRIVEVDASTTVGDRRNIGAEAGKGEFIVHVDDDDWYSRDYTNTVLSSLVASGAAVAGLGEFFFYDVFFRRGWSTIKLMVPTGATMAYRRSTWLETPFRSTQLGEDNDFLTDLREKGAEFVTLHRPDLFTYIRHRRNSSLGHIDPIFDEGQTAEARAIMGDDVDFYDDLSELYPRSTGTSELGPQWHLPAHLRKAVRP